jgi:hypothetical protein
MIIIININVNSYLAEITHYFITYCNIYEISLRIESRNRWPSPPVTKKN